MQQKQNQRNTQMTVYGDIHIYICYYTILDFKYSLLSKTNNLYEGPGGSKDPRMDGTETTMAASISLPGA